MTNAAAPPDSASGVEVSRGSREGSVIIEQGLQSDSVVYQIEIRNAGSRAVDLAELSLVDRSGAGVEGNGLELVRGTFELAPNEVAVILTHESVDPGDYYRSLFRNVYRLMPAGECVSLDDGLALAGLGNSGIPLDPVRFDVNGKCCTDKAGGTCPCYAGSFCNAGCDNGGCWSNVSFQTCCNVIRGCGHVADDLNICTAGGCPDSPSLSCCDE